MTTEETNDHDLDGCTGSWEQYGTSRKCADCKESMSPLDPVEYAVRSAIGFRDAVMSLLKTNRYVYARAEGTSPNRRIVMDEREIGMESMLFAQDVPILMEDYAQTLVRTERAGQEIPEIIVFAAK